MGAMKSHAMDMESMRMLLVMNDISNARDEYREEMFRLRDENERLRRALRFYADPESHEGSGWQGDRDPSLIATDRGRVANRALQEEQQS